MQKIFKIAFIIIFIGQIAGRWFSSPLLDYIFKPLIMPCLALYLYFSVQGRLSKFIKFIIIGFVFSWLGDIALMLEKFNSQLFLLGLAFFLVAHIFYIIAFNTHIQKPFFQEKPLLFVPLFLYGIGFFYFLYPNLQGFTIPVLLYTIVITAMAIFALNRKNNVSLLSFKLIFRGALFFVLSDSLIALNKFMLQIPYNGLWVMLTYMVAQYLIAEGSKQN
ncbi:lysoplasmalogenase [Thermoflexibacter ruber]|uniref:Uncharacterized membrane protein YhhN n=1 Tax=Thermoflexibacter ruber TaxID=1003 RepID=A0A1I2A6G5_9BACT|nr:lysoplasmalogenase [Thermoflexibacter ruber]SFE39426.1 Uncharacterized membrane protein YhhN [Thermoflexibacter ruber]